MDDASDGLQSILIEIGVDGLDGRPIAVGHGAELEETLVFLNGRKPLPLRAVSANIQRVVVADASWFTHNTTFYLTLQK